MVLVIIITSEGMEILKAHVQSENPVLTPEDTILAALLYVTKVDLINVEFPKIHARNGKNTP